MCVYMCTHAFVCDPLGPELGGMGLCKCYKTNKLND